MKPSKKLVGINVISLLIFIILLVLVKFTEIFTSLNILIHSLFLSIQNDILIDISRFIGFIFDTTSLVIISLVISIYLLKKYSKKEALFFSITMLADAIILFIFKNLIKLQRPLNGFETNFGFPSGHTTTAIVFFGLLTYFLLKKSKLKIVYISAFMVLLIALSRLYLGVHWLTDIIGGLALGTFILTLSFILKNDRS